MDAKEWTIENEKERLLKSLRTIKPGSELYENVVDDLRTLVEAERVKNPNSVSADTIVMALTNIFGILLILNYERLNVVSSRAIGFVLKR